MTRSIILALTLLLVAAATSAAADRHELYGFAPAYLSDTLPTYVPAESYPRPSRTREAVILLSVDKKGKVTKVVAADTVDARLTDYVREYLLSLSMIPAERKGKKVNSQLPIAVTFRTRVKNPIFHFPIESNGFISNRERFLAAVEANGVKLPKLLSFPSYFTEVHWSDTLKPYPYVLLKLTLGPDGRPLAVDTVQSTQSGLTMTTASAALWASYEPAQVDGKPIEADCYLLVSYFPQIVYPTPRWKAGRTDSTSVMEQLRVRLIADTVGLMAQPIPRKQPGNVWTVSEARGKYDTVSAVLAVDTTGRANLTTQDRIPPDEWQILRLLVSRISYYPARDYGGASQLSTGPIRIILDGSEKVRMEYAW